MNLLCMVSVQEQTSNERSRSMLSELCTQGEKPKFCRKVVKLPSSPQTGLVFPNLTFPTKIHLAQESLFWIFSFLDVWKGYQQETSSFFPYSQTCTASPSIRIPRTQQEIDTQRRRKKNSRQTKAHTPLASFKDTIRLIKLIIYAQSQCNSYFISATFHNVFLVGLI